MKNRTFSKYKSKKVEVDGLKFDSKKEANRYCELKLLERSGQIQNLRMQVPFELIPNQYEEHREFTKTGKEKIVKKLVERKCSYIADFVYEENGKTIVEDAKGFRNSTAYALFVIKRKLMLLIYKIRVVEV